MATASIILLLITFLITRIECARILAYFPTPSISHQVVFRPLTQALAARGHDVTVVTTDPVFPKGQAPANFTEIDVHDISYELWNDLLANHKGNKRDIFQQVRLFFAKSANILVRQLETPEVKKIMRKGRKYYDVIILEACNRPLLGFSHKFDASIISVSSFGAVERQYSALGAPIHPLVYPTAGRQRLYNLSLYEKAYELLGFAVIGYLIDDTELYDYNIMKKYFGSDIPIYSELKNKISMMFLNEHPIWASNRPVPPSIIYVGGIHQRKEKQLPVELKKFLDSSKHGVIYVSFGTNVLPSVLSPEKIEIMAKVFSELRYDVLWKYDKDVLPGIQPKNIKLSKWFPQSDLLKHPKVKLFVTQGGLQSTDEAIDATVPVIGIPIVADQWYNVEKYAYHNIGLQLDITTFTEQEFKSAVQKVINNESFKNNIKKLRNIMRDYPIKPVDRAIWWTEHIIKHGGSHLRSPASNMSWIDYYEVKLVLIMLSILIITLVLLCWLAIRILNFMYNIYRINIKLKSHYD